MENGVLKIEDYIFNVVVILIEKFYVRIINLMSVIKIS